MSNVVTRNLIYTVVNAREQDDILNAEINDGIKRMQEAYWAREVGDKTMPPLIQAGDFFGMLMIISILFLTIISIAFGFHWLYLIVPVILEILRSKKISAAQNEESAEHCYSSIPAQEAFDYTATFNKSYYDGISDKLVSRSKYKKEQRNDLFGTFDTSDLEGALDYLSSDGIEWHQFVGVIKDVQQNRASENERQYRQEMDRQMAQASINASRAQEIESQANADAANARMEKDRALKEKILSDKY